MKKLYRILLLVIALIFLSTYTPGKFKENLENENLMNVSIYEFDENSNFLKRIEAESANIVSFNWDLKNVRIIDGDGKVVADNLKNVSYISTYDLKKN